MGEVLLHKEENNGGKCMTLGTWGIIKEAPSLLALIPMILYIIMAFNEKIDQLVNLLILRHSRM